MADEQTQFENLLQGLMSPENEARSQSEEAYEAVPPVARIPFLVKGMRNTSANMEVRTMAAVLLRRVFTTSFDDFWPTVDAETGASLKQQMLVCIQEETSPPIRRKMCEATAEFARNMLDDDGNNTWPEMLKFLFDLANSQDAGMRESSLHVFSLVPSVFGNQQKQYLDLIRQMLQQSLQDQNHAEIRQAAVKATTAFLLANEKDHHILSHCKDLLPSVIKGVAESVMNQEEDSTMKSLIELAENMPKFLRTQLDPIMELCVKVVSDSEIQDSIRHLALEVIVTLAETAPAMVRKNAVNFLPGLVQQILIMMVDLEEDAEWTVSDDADDEDSDSNAIAAESALDRLACGLGGRTMLPPIIQNIPQMLANTDWRYRHAALMAISASGEGCQKQMEIMLPNIVEAVLPYLQDQHPRVRYACCNSLGQMSTDFAPVFQKKFHERVVPGLLLVMDDYGNPRVQAHAGAALVNFSEDCPQKILTPYLDPIISKLEQILTAKFKETAEKGTKLVLEQIVTTLASVADTAEDKFTQYYDRFMPSLKYIVQNATSPELRLLRGKTIECISLIGLAVNKEKFMEDCSDVMQLLLKTQTDWADLPEDDPQLSYMISAWTRMCKIMGTAFAQYLPLVMGPVIKAASIKPEVALVDSDDMKAMDSDTEWQFLTLGDQQSFGIRTAGLEEKATACQMLVCYARELKEGFAEYAEQVVKIMVTHLKFYFHDGVRIAAAESLPYLLECARIRGQEYINNMWQYICPELLNAIETEPENDVKSEHMSGLAQCIEKMGAGCFNAEQMDHVKRILEGTLTYHFTRQMARQEQRKDEDYDEVLEETLLDEDDEDVYVLSKVSDITHALFGTHKEAFLPIFEQLLPHFVKLLGEDRPWPDKQWSLCIFDDLIEHTGAHSEPFQQYFLQPMLQYICDEQPEVRQAAAYGAGVMGQFGGQPYTQACGQSIPLLVKSIETPESRDEKNISPTENAISAVVKICKYAPSSTDVDSILPRWLSWLPVWEDAEESLHVYGYLCDLIEGNHPVVLGENNQNLPRLIEIIAEAFHREAISTEEDVATRMLNIVKQIQNNGEIFQACISQLAEHQKVALSSVMSA